MQPEQLPKKEPLLSSHRIRTCNPWNTQLILLDQKLVIHRLHVQILWKGKVFENLSLRGYCSAALPKATALTTLGQKAQKRILKFKQSGYALVSFLASRLKMPCFGLQQRHGSKR